MKYTVPPQLLTRLHLSLSKTGPNLRGFVVQKQASNWKERERERGAILVSQRSIKFPPLLYKTHKILPAVRALAKIHTAASLSDEYIFVGTL